MVEVHISGGIAFCIEIKYELLIEVLTNASIHPDTFIGICFPDGTKGAFRKQDVVAVSECESF